MNHIGDTDKNNIHIYLVQTQLKNIPQHFLLDKPIDVKS